ncbi:MAG: transketolase family protein [Candidatus Poribacteria bacterium]|nr:transketolase family protein [Candidatus Poribacteria bacterium]
MAERTMGEATRDTYGRVLIELGAKNPDVVVLDADLSSSTRTSKFRAAYPDRFFNFGIAEANMVGAAAGFALAGKTPFLSTFAVFMMAKGYDQLRQSIAYPGLNVKVVATHGGISIGEDGPSQMSIEDIALAATLPGFTVCLPSDQVCAYAILHQVAEQPNSCFVRVGRPRVPIVYDANSKITVGKANQLADGSDVTVIANGLLVSEALDAAEILGKQGISVRVLDMHTIKPLDDAAVAKAAKETGAIVVAEEHSVIGGLGAMVAQSAARSHPVPMEFVGVQDTYAESGLPEELLERYGLVAVDVVRAVKKVVARKG